MRSWGMVGGRGMVLDRSMVCYWTMVCYWAMVCNWMGGWGGVLYCQGGYKQQRGENLHRKTSSDHLTLACSDKTIIN